MEAKRNRTSREVAEAFLTCLGSQAARKYADATGHALTPVALDENSRFLVSLEDDGIPCIPLIGEAHFRRRYRDVPLHMHPGCYEFTLCLRGNLEYECRGKKYRFHPGDVFAVGPDVPHRITAFPKGFRRYRMLLKMKAGDGRILGFPAEESKWIKESLRAKEVNHFSDTGEVRRGFQRVMSFIREMPENTPERRIKLKVSVAQLLLSIIAQANRPLHAQGCNKVETVVDEMRIHPERKYSVDEIAVRLNMNATSFLHKFKSATGLPPHAFLAECRIHKAKELLLNSVSVSATAHRCGFTSVKHFATVFRRFTGLPPSKWNSDASLSGESGS